LEKKKIILIDGNNIAYRAFFALPPSIATSSGTLTNAVYGFTTMLIKLIDEQDPTQIITLFDSKKATFRHRIYKDYKAKRKSMPGELFEQLLLIREVLCAFRIPSIEMEDFEADDLIATITRKKYDDFDDILIVSSDKDILQLVDQKVSVLSMKKGITETVLFDREGVKDKFGLEPTKLQEYLSLTGDASDNIPGVAGIGPKTALTLIKQYGSIEGVYENIESIKSPKLRENLVREKENAFRSRELIRLIMDVDIELPATAELPFKGSNYDAVMKVFESLEFRTLKERVKKLKIFEAKEPGRNEASPSIEVELTLIDESFDGLSLKKGEQVYLSPCFFEKKEKKEAGMFIFSDPLKLYFLPSLADLEGTLGQKISLIADEGVSKCGYDFKSIYKFFGKRGVELKGMFSDIKIMYLLLHPDKTEIELFELAAALGIDACVFEDVKLEVSGQDKGPSIYGEEKDVQLDFGHVGTQAGGQEHLETARDYLKRDIGYLQSLPAIRKTLWDRLEDEDMTLLFKEIEQPLIKVLALMELKGINIDRQYLGALIKDYDADIRELTSQIHLIAGQKFNINSPQQLAAVLFDKLGLKPSKKTKTGFSTNAQSLVMICDSHPIIEKIIEYREKVKLKNTYIDVLPGLIDPYDRRVHTTYHQLGTTTGRISSSEPNLQNIPVRTELGRQIRKAFIPGKGYDLILTADYSQIELRILAHMSRDEKLMDTFNRDGDIHSATAAEIFGIGEKEVTEDHRRRAKAINFGIIYGMTEYGLRIRLAITEEQAREYIRLYFERYPRVRDYIKSLIASAYDKGYTETLFKRRRYIHELASPNARMRSLGERLAVNSPIQGTAADIMKIATIDLHREIEKSRLDANILLQVHDELVLEIKGKDQAEISEIVKKSMERCVKLDVKLKIDIKSAKNWYI
jgi:DNA polymerase I